MKFPPFVYSLSLVIVHQLLSVAALPIDDALPGAENFLPRDGEITEEMYSETEHKRSAPVDTESFTAGDFIYHTYEQLSTELYSWLFEMDIVKSSHTVQTVLENNGLLEPEQEGANQRDRRTAGVLSNYLWPNKRIPYVFESIISSAGREAALKGMEHWMKYTCIQFVPRENHDSDYIEFAERDGCWSYVGKQGGVQLISIGRGPESFCKFPGVVLHELGHAIGLWHEQSRTDRDDYIEIMWQNIEPEFYPNFYKYSISEIETFSLPYDYGSIMHYSQQSFSINGEATIVALDPDVKRMGQRMSLSLCDSKTVNLMYRCVVTNSSTPGNLSNSFAIPQDAFLIVNSQTHACLDVSNRTTDWTAPIMDQHDFTGLYYVALTECHPTNHDQFWKWTKDGSLLHLGTFMCLTALDTRNVPMFVTDTDLLVLMHCRSGYGRQHWVCADNFLENPNLGKCVSAAANAQKRDKRNSDSHLDDTINELDNELKNFVSGRRPTMAMKVIQKFHIFFEEPKLSNYSMMTSLDHCQQTEISQTWNSVYYAEDCIQLGASLCSVPTNQSHDLPTCYNKDMSDSTGLRFFYVIWIGCEELGYYASGFYHTDQISGNGATAVLTGINCCPSGSIFTGHTDSPPAIVEEECIDIEWWNWQQTLISEGWFSCPRGMFLKSFLITIRPYTLGHFIWKVKCCKPTSSSVVYEHCYKDYGAVSKDTSIHRCMLEGYHVTGMYKRCNEAGVECVEEIMCCMALGV